MLNTLIRCSVLMIILAGCAHRGAVRVDCDGPLRAINRGAQSKDAPVSVAPASPGTPTGGGTNAP
jgi:hypothetical protein